MVTIGLFDSGYGGLTVAREVVRQMPYANMVYFGDNGRAPYGERTREEILKFTREIIEFLAEKGVDAVIIACNTATAAALDDVVDEYPFPIIGMIEPGAEAGLEISRNKRIGVIATQFTTDQKAYQKEMENKAADVTVLSVACPSFCSLVESGKAESPEIEAAARLYLGAYKGSGIDTMVLGCTHYPLLMDVVKRNLPNGVEIVDPAVAVVGRAKDILSHKLSASHTDLAYRRFYTSGEPHMFRRLGAGFFTYPIDHVEKVSME